MHHITLYELHQKIKDSLLNAFPLPVWITAEISEMKVNYAGHCYLELVEKDPTDGIKVRAKVAANIWANKFRLIKTYFESSSRIALSEGLKVLVKVDVRFHELYGMSLSIVDIDPAYTIGEMKLQRNLIVQQLIDEGVIDLNKELIMPVVPQRIAVISSKSAAGYQDFYNQLVHNSSGYRFSVVLFQAVMQGNESEPSIVEALDCIYQRLDEFDAVVVIRGGGSQTDLSCFDSYGLSANIAQFPLPVLTGIGHDKDESVVDLVAYRSFKTPTAVASFLVEVVAEFEAEVVETSSDIIRTARQLLNGGKVALGRVEQNLQNSFRDFLRGEEKRVDSIVGLLSRGVTDRISSQRRMIDAFLFSAEKSAGKYLKVEQNRLDGYSNRVAGSSKIHLISTRHRLDNYEVRLKSANPREMLKKGYSITLHEGKIVRDLTSLKGKSVETVLDAGTILSEVKEVKLKK